MPAVVLWHGPAFPAIKNGLFAVFFLIMVRVRWLVANIAKVNVAAVVAKVGAVYRFKRSGL